VLLFVKFHYQYVKSGDWVVNKQNVVLELDGGGFQTAPPQRNETLNRRSHNRAASKKIIKVFRRPFNQQMAYPQFSCVIYGAPCALAAK
jgi:hypothetical protein